MRYFTCSAQSGSVVSLALVPDFVCNGPGIYK